MKPKPGMICILKSVWESEKVLKRKLIAGLKKYRDHSCDIPEGDFGVRACCLTRDYENHRPNCKISNLIAGAEA